MTYEHAVTTSRTLLSRGTQNLCVPASLDAVLRVTDIEEQDYLRIAEAFDREAGLSDEAFEQLYKQGLAGREHEELAAKYFPGKIALDGRPTFEWEISTHDDPFDPAIDDELSKPKPEHYALESVLVHIKAQRNAKEMSQKRYKRLREIYRAAIGAYIMLDNAFDRELTVLGKSTPNHVFGITRSGDGMFHEYNLDLSRSGRQKAMKRIGPYTLRGIVGLPDDQPPAHWPAPHKENPYLLDLVQYGEDECFAFRIYPPES